MIMIIMLNKCACCFMCWSIWQGKGEMTTYWLHSSSPALRRQDNNTMSRSKVNFAEDCSCW